MAMVGTSNALAGFDTTAPGCKRLGVNAISAMVICVGRHASSIFCVTPFLLCREERALKNYALRLFGSFDAGLWPGAVVVHARIAYSWLFSFVRNVSTLVTQNSTERTDWFFVHEEAG